MEISKKFTSIAGSYKARPKSMIHFPTTTVCTHIQSNMCFKLSYTLPVGGIRFMTTR